MNFSLDVLWREDWKQYYISIATICVVLGVQQLMLVCTRARLFGFVKSVDSYIPRYSVKSELKKSLMMFLLAFVSVLVMRYMDPVEDITTIPVRNVLDSTAFDAWGEYRPVPKKKSFEVDLSDETERKSALYLMDHMELRIPDGHDFVAASEFGSNRRVIFSRKYKHMVNPKIIQHGEQRKWIKCNGAVHTHYTSIKIAYRDKRLGEPQVLSLNNQEALQIQCTFVLFNV